MLKLVQSNFGEFDLAFDPTAGVDVDSAFSTLVFATIFTDAEASNLQEPDRYQRRGYWYDPEAGTLVWWFRQQALSTAVRVDVVENMREALSLQPELTEVSVIDITPAGTVSSLLVSIYAIYNGVKSSIFINVL